MFITKNVGIYGNKTLWAAMMGEIIIILHVHGLY